MTVQTASRQTQTKRSLEEAPVSVRIKISGLWVAMLFVFVYVDLFSLYRPDIRADLEVGELASFTVGGPFLVAVTTYILIPSLMVAGSLMMRAGIARMSNLVLSTVYALTIVGGAIGEWGYYVLGSAAEVVLLAAVAVHAWKWPVKEAT